MFDSLQVSMLRVAQGLPALPCRDSWLAARLAAHVEPPRDVAEAIDAAAADRDFSASRGRRAGDFLVRRV